MSSTIGADVRRGVIVRGGSKAVKNPVSSKIARAASTELLNAGFLVSPNVLEGFSQAEVVSLVKSAASVAGEDRNWRPVYPGFPKQVRDTPVTTLIADQILHYISGGEIQPQFEDVNYKDLPWADTLRNAKPLKVLHTPAELAGAISDIVTDKVAMSEADADFLSLLVNTSSLDLEKARDIARKAVNQENVQHLVRSLNDPAEDIFAEFVSVVRTPDSLLRLVYACFGEAASAEKQDVFEAAAYHLKRDSDWAIRFKSMSKASRRALVARLGQLSKGFNADNLVGRSEQWRHLMRMVHPFSVLSKTDDDAKRALDVIHGNIDYRTLNSRVEEGIANRKIGEVAELLVEHRPSELIRRLVTLAKADRGYKNLAASVVAVADRVPMGTLISAWEGVSSANAEGAKVTRIAGAKNRVRKDKKDDDSKISDNAVTALVEALESAMVSKMAKMEATAGTVGVRSKEPVSLVRRDLSSSDRIIHRGEVVGAVGAGGTLRFFQHWHNDQKHGGYVDLGVVIADENFNALGNVSWDSYSRSHGADGWSAYSGDTYVMPGDSAVEFIDVDVSKCLLAHPNAKWAVTTLVSYSGVAFDALDVYAGVAYRDKPNDGAPFDARSVISACNVSGNGTSLVVCATDLSTGETIWVDTCTGGDQSCHTAGSDSSLLSVAQFEASRTRFTYGKLAQLWAQAHTLPMAFMVDADTETLRKVL